MINTSKPIEPSTEDLCDFIINKLGISEDAINLGIKRAHLENSPLPIVMWSYGLLNLIQLNLVLSWQKNH